MKDLDEKVKGFRQQHTLDLTAEIGAEDHALESRGLRLVCHAADLDRLAGTTIDFRDTPERRSRPRSGEAAATSPPSEDEAREALREVINPEELAEAGPGALLQAEAGQRRGVRALERTLALSCAAHGASLLFCSGLSRGAEFRPAGSARRRVVTFTGRLPRLS